MIDPKRLELGMYEDIPHLLTPVVVDPKQAANALRWGVREMEERYKTLAAHGVRNIEQYNRNIRAAMLEPAAEEPEATAELKTMPYIVVIIDELADLMMAAGKEVEESIARLAQMARAVGIHLILATQRPSVDVITGLIKANLPARIAFRVASKIDSRTILDGNGAEQLLGKGDMLYLPPASSRFVRIHGPYISEQETARLCSFLRKQGKPIYDTTITAEDKPAEKIEFEKDELYDEAARIVVSSGQASISYLQRRLRIGFSRAARLDRHDGNGRRRLPGGQRQARSARRPELLRGSGRAAEIAHERTTSHRLIRPHPALAAGVASSGRVRALARRSRAQTAAATLYEQAQAAEQTARADVAHVAGQLARGARRRTRASCCGIRRAAMPTTRSGRRPDCLTTAFQTSGRCADRRQAERLLKWLQQEYPSSPLVKQRRRRRCRRSDKRPPGPRRRRALPRRLRRRTRRRRRRRRQRRCRPQGQRPSVERHHGQRRCRAAIASRSSSARKSRSPATASTNPDRVFFDFANATAPASLVEHGADASSGPLVKARAHRAAIRTA